MGGARQRCRQLSQVARKAARNGGRADVVVDQEVQANHQGPRGAEYLVDVSHIREADLCGVHHIDLKLRGLQLLIVRVFLLGHRTFLVNR